MRHPDLRQLSDADVQYELETSKQQIEDGTGRTPAAFAYPYGYTDARIKRLTASCFDLACGTRLRFVNAGADAYDLPRLDVFYFREPRRFRELLEGRSAGYVAFRRLLREARQRLSG